MEQVLFEQHVRLIHRVNKVFSPKGRGFIEWMTLILAILCSVAMFVLHVVYVTNSSNANVNCIMSYLEAHQISPGQLKNDYDVIKLSVTESGWVKLPNMQQCLTFDGHMKNTDECSLESVLSASKTQYLFSLDQGILMLNHSAAIAHHTLRTLEITFPNDATCFGPNVAQNLVRNYAGYDLPVINWAVAAFEGEGYLYKIYPQGKLYNLNQAGDFVSKKGVSMKDEKQRVYEFNARIRHPRQLSDRVVRVAVQLTNKAEGLIATAWRGLNKNEALKPHLTIVEEKVLYVRNNYLPSWEQVQASLEGMVDLVESALSIVNTRWHYLKGADTFNQYLAFRVGVIFTTSFLFFVCTTLVSYVLRETQDRMLKFTYHLQHHINHQLPYVTLVMAHLTESLVFVPIIVGMHFFLVNFFGDQLLAFLVMLLVWTGEVFSVMSLRTKASIKYFPRLFAAYFFIFHIYFFCFPFGFIYLAWLCTMLYVLHSCMHLMNKYEIPSLEQGVVNSRTPRIGLGNSMEEDDIVAEEIVLGGAGNGDDSEIPAGRNPNVYRRIQALKRAAQLADEQAAIMAARKGHHHRAGRLRSNSNEFSQRYKAVGSMLRSARNSQNSNSDPDMQSRVRTISAEQRLLLKSKFAVQPIPDFDRNKNRLLATSMTPNSTQRKHGKQGEGKLIVPADPNIEKTKKVVGKLPILALGRSDSMAEYMTKDEETTHVKNAVKSQAVSKVSRVDRPQGTTQVVTQPSGIPTALNRGTGVIAKPIGSLISPDFQDDYSLMDLEDDAFMGKQPLSPHRSGTSTGLSTPNTKNGHRRATNRQVDVSVRDAVGILSGQQSEVFDQEYQFDQRTGDEESESGDPDQEDEEKRMFVFGAVTGASLTRGRSGSGSQVFDGAASSRKKSEFVTGVRSPKKKNLRLPKPSVTDSVRAKDFETVPISTSMSNKYKVKQSINNASLNETLEQRRARLAGKQTGSGGTGQGAKAVEAIVRQRLNSEDAQVDQEMEEYHHTHCEKSQPEESSRSTGSSSNNNPAKKAPTISDCGYQSTEFSVFGPLLKNAN